VLDHWNKSMGRRVTPLGHIILIPPFFVLSPSCWVIKRETTTTNFIVFGLTRSILKPMIYRSQENHASHNTTNVVKGKSEDWFIVWLCDCPMSVVSLFLLISSGSFEETKKTIQNGSKQNFSNCHLFSWNSSKMFITP
jgi:hypothetical protein